MDDDWLPYDLKQRRSRRQNSQRKQVKGWLPTLVFGSLGVLSIGVGMMEMGAGQMTELACVRSSTKRLACSRTVTTGLTREATIEIKNIEKSEMQQVGRKFRNAYRVMLVTTDGEVPLTEDFKSDKRESLEHIEQLNEFIQNDSEPKLQLQVDDRAQSNLFGLMFILTGILWVLMAIVVQIAVNRKSVLTQKVY
ncbi:MAG: hypothetical protein NT070_16335 [Cyanobacteria bacterium]|nr:hypothetical protein [Cyanobacteriota bacterium]